MRNYENDEPPTTVQAVVGRFHEHRRWSAISVNEQVCAADAQIWCNLPEAWWAK
nr:hypothetical protein [Nitrosomonas nitrosa]